MSTTASKAVPGPWGLLSRVAAALLGGYVFCWGLGTLGIAAGVAAGVDWGEAWTLCMLLLFPVYLAAFLWAFAARSVLKVWLCLGGGGAVMSAAALWLQSAIMN